MERLGASAVVSFRIGVLTLAAVTGSPGAGWPDASARLTLSTDEAIYYVGEPIRFVLVASNDGDVPLRGYFDLVPTHDQVTIYYRKGSGSFRELFRRQTLQRQEPDTIRIAPQIEPGRERTSELVLAWNPEAPGLLLDEPGDFEFYVACRMLGEAHHATL